MNEIKKFWNAMSEYSSLVERRREYLQKEKELDTRLSACQKCPFMISEYLLKSRQLNRKLSENLYSKSCYEFPVIYMEQMDTLKAIQLDIKDKNDNEICYYILPDMNKKLDELTDVR